MSVSINMIAKGLGDQSRRKIADVHQSQAFDL